MSRRTNEELPAISSQYSWYVITAKNNCNHNFHIISIYIPHSILVINNSFSKLLSTAISWTSDVCQVWQIWSIHLKLTAANLEFRVSNWDWYFYYSLLNRLFRTSRESKYVDNDYNRRWQHWAMSVTTWTLLQHINRIYKLSKTRVRGLRPN